MTDDGRYTRFRSANALLNLAELCNDCGSVVWDRSKHDEHHRQGDAVKDEMVELRYRIDSLNSLHMTYGTGIMTATEPRPLPCQHEYVGQNETGGAYCRKCGQRPVSEQRTIT